MPGVGIRMAITIDSDVFVLLDLTRLISRVGRGPLTGIDRVELAYLEEFLRRDTQCGFLIRTGYGFAILDREGGSALRDRLKGRTAWCAADWRSRLHRRQAPLRQRAETEIRRLAVATPGRSQLIKALRRFPPVDWWYLNVGHSNLHSDVMRAMRGRRIGVFIHDTIPLDHPQFQTPRSRIRFREKLAVVSRFADLVIYNSVHSREAAESHFHDLGRVPDGLVAHLGVSVPEWDGTPSSRIVDPQRPFFLSVGTIEPRKNHLLLLDVWQILAERLPPERMPHLYIIGRRGWMNDDVFLRLDRRSGDVAFVFECGDVDDVDLTQMLASAQALLFPSLAEGFGLPPIEAAAQGTPVVCGALPVYQEFLGDFPVYLPLHDRYLWAQEIEKMSGQKRLASKDGAIEVPSWHDHFQKVFSALQAAFDPNL